MIDAAINRLLHGPTLRLRQSALARSNEALPLEQLTLALGEVFDLAHGEYPSDDADLEGMDEPLLVSQSERPEEAP
jgi:hypothetical protein